MQTGSTPLETEAERCAASGEANELMNASPLGVCVEQAEAYIVCVHNDCKNRQKYILYVFITIARTGRGIYDA
jgi:hypothetical protein